MSERVVLRRGQRPPARRSKTRPRVRRKRTLLQKWQMPLLAVSGAAALVAAAWLYQVPTKLWLAAANGVAKAGFAVREVEVTGLKNMPRLPLYTAALDGASDSMLLVDLDDVKAQLELLPWIEEAHVGRALPDKLMIDVVERVPAAIWQKDGRHMLVDAEGRILTHKDLARFAHLPLVVDEGANVRAGEIAALLDDYPALAEHFSSATWVGGRRWDVALKSGEVIELPEGETAMRAALDSFVRLDRDTGLVGRGFATFDFRIADRMVVRVSREPGAALVPVEGTEI